jgi:hypothetical protein
MQPGRHHRTVELRDARRRERVHQRSQVGETDESNLLPHQIGQLESLQKPGDAETASGGDDRAGSLF